MTTKKLCILFALALCLPFAGTSQAATIFYNSQATYLAAIASPGTDTFDDLPGGPLTGPLNRNAGIHTYTASTVGDFFLVGIPGDSWLSTDVVGDTMTFNNFSAGVRGFGAFFFATDVDGVFLPGKSITVSATDGSGTNSTTLTNTTTSTFLGIVSDQAFTSITVKSVQDGLVWPTMNDVILGAVSTAPQVPEPGTWATVCLGLAGLGFAARRRRGSRS
ncbi:MAG: PEP-CTERM sorting domain-containing protein [Acidobacteria bacterium]|nr:PEP-CTERM sorting domain-containing protein [Acidobacteriota bacterium]